MTTPHKHAALIKAWANGVPIEYQSRQSGWIVSHYPSWDPAIKYRVKPEIKPNMVTWHPVFTGGDVATGHKPTRPKYDKATAILRIEIDHNDPDNPVLVSATLEKP